MGITSSFKQANGFNFTTQGCGCSSSCPDKFGCPPDTPPDFVIKRHDTRPAFKVSIKDCDGPIDLSGLVLEVNMWAKGRLRDALEEDGTYFRLADNIGFEQAMIGDVIILDRVRLPEHMLVTGFDEKNKLIQVQRGYHGTTPSAWSKGTTIRIFRILNSPATTEMVVDDITGLDGTITKDQLIESFLVYEWKPNDVCLPGCYWLEFKLLKMINLVLYTPGKQWCGPTHTASGGYFFTGTLMTGSSVQLSYNSVDDVFELPSEVWAGDFHLHTDDYYYTGLTHDDGFVYLNRDGIPDSGDICYSADGVSVLSAMSSLDSLSNISFIGMGLTPEDFGCTLGSGVESVRRFPCGDVEGFLIKISDSFTAEL